MHAFYVVFLLWNVVQDNDMQVEEADHLQNLISAAHASNLDFYYALSPGLDIAYSNSKEVNKTAIHQSYKMSYWLCCHADPLQVATLKRKLDQVAQLGCKAFALLFDDIEAEMSKPDKEAFQSFAAAQVWRVIPIGVVDDDNDVDKFPCQVSVTNEIYQHLGQPKFLFCPTQYCTARAVPTVNVMCNVIIS